MSISTSFRMISSKFPQFPIPNSPFSKTLFSPFPPQLPPFSIPLRKPISFQRLAAKQPHQSLPAPPNSSSPPEDLPPKLQEIITLFQSVQDHKAKYQQLLFYGRKLSPLDTQYKTNENKVEGCVSQVWVRAYLDSHKNVWFQADSDSVLTKGLAALLVQGLSGRPAGEILRVRPDFVALLGLQQSLTPSRNNGFLNMLKLMQNKALLLGLRAEKESEAQERGLSSGMGNGDLSTVSGPDSAVEVADAGSLGSKAAHGGVSGSGGGLGSRGARIRERLEKELNPVELVIEDLSYQHAGHAGVRGSTDGETHFNLKIVSEEFEGKSLVKRHRMVYAMLQDELQDGLHALSIVAKTPSEVGR